jgi:hypothetical protein
MILSPLRRIALSYSAVVAFLIGSSHGWAQYSSGDARPEAPISLDPGPLAADRKPVAIFFPPLPPVLGDRLQVEAGSLSSSRGIPSPDLAPYVGEIFYPPLSARLDRKTLPASLRRRIESYRDQQTVLLKELRAELARVQAEPPDVRLNALGTLAERQASRLVALEQAAEQLRDDLIESDAGWDDLREWHLSTPEALGFTPREVAMVMRGAAYYFPALQLGQRGLLREIAFELSQAGTRTSDVAGGQFFSPELARIVVPTDLSPAAAKSLADYQARKARLKKELYDTISTLDKPGLNLGRGKELRALVARQAPELVALEVAAENFRRLLPAHYGPSAPRSALPAALVRDIEDWSQRRAALQRENTAKVNALIAPYKNRVFLFPRFDEAVVTVQASSVRSGQSLTPAEREILQRGADEIIADYAARYPVFVEQREALYTEVGRAIGNSQRAAIVAAFDEALRIGSLNAVSSAREDYRTAVFEPGLSPAQRRLLLSGALQQLKPRLPSGEKQPVTRS